MMGGHVSTTAPEGYATAAAERRCEPRAVVDLAVQVKGIDADGERFEQAAVARNISLAGALLLGIQRTLRPGDLLRVRHGDRSAKFRVVWASPSTLAGAIKVAVHRIETEPSIWKESAGREAEAPAKPNRPRMAATAQS
jgi:hypothetical protein